MKFRAKMARYFAIAAVILSAVILSAAKDLHAQSFPARPTGMVNDYAGMLSGSERQALEQRLRAYRDSTSNVIVVTTIENLQGIDIESFASKMFNDWKMWEGDRKNGVLFLISRDDRQMRIEVGYGLEAVVPDILAGRIINDILRPGFRNGDVAGALTEATTTVMRLASGEFEAVAQRAPSGNPDDFKNLGFLVIMIIYIVFQLATSSRRRRSHHLGGNGVIIMHGLASMLSNRGGGGFGGGGFGGFGGGGGFGSGGGGASGGW